MKKGKYNCKVIVLTMLLFAAAIQAAEADSPTVVYGFNLDYYGKYIWRGQNLNNTGVLQPAISMAACGFTVSVWSNFDLTDKSHTAPDNSGNFSEFDFTLDYSSTLSGFDELTYSAGIIYYRFPHTLFDPTIEMYGSLKFDLPAAPFITWYRDIGVIEGGYIQLGLGHTIDKIIAVNDRCYCGVAAGTSIGWGSAGYNRGYFSIGNGDFNDITLSVSLPLCLWNWTIEFSINHSFMLRDAISQAVYKNNNTWLGIGLVTTY